MNPTLQFIIDNWIIIAPVVYEIIARLWPTKWNISLLDKIWQLINTIIPNIRKPDGKEIIPGDQKALDVPAVSSKKKGLLKNLVKVAVNRFILKCIVLLCLASPAIAQNNGAFKAIASYNTDSATVKSYINTLQTNYGNPGALYYNKQSSKWRIYEDSTWYDLRTSGGGGGGTVTSVSGTPDRITVTDSTTTPVIDIAATYVGQTSITTLGTIATGVWNATTIPTTKGGTGLTSIGSPLQVLRVNGIGNGLEYATPTTYTFNNGLTTTGTNTVWGGPLNSGTSIDGTGHQLNIFNLDGLNLNASTGDLSFTTDIGNISLQSQGNLFQSSVGPSAMWGSTISLLTTGGSTGNLSIRTGDTPGPGAESTGLILIQPGRAFGAKPGNIIISGGNNTTTDDSGNIYLSAASYTGDSVTFSVESTGTIRCRTHSEIVFEPNTLSTSTNITLNNTRLASNMISGTATLVAGTATVTFDYISGDIVLLTVQTPGGTQGFLSIVPGVGSFDIVSTSATETSTVGWFVVTHF